MFTVQRVKFNIPGKTFLLGEYVALYGGPALLLAHGPDFLVEFREGRADVPFHPDSPAGEWIELHDDLFKNTEITFRDPHEGAGGFGASTAQFIATYLYALSKRKIYSAGRELNSLQKWAIVEDYKNIFEGEKTIPSGYDLMVQMGRGLQVVDANKNRADQILWPFKEVEISIYKTPVKVNTHEHLKKMKLTKDTVAALESCAAKCVSALEQSSKKSFFEALQEFSRIQEKAKLLAPESAELMQKCLKAKGVLAARGCGSLGADVVVVFAEKGCELDKTVLHSLIPIWNSNMESV